MEPSPSSAQAALTKSAIRASQFLGLNDAAMACSLGLQVADIEPMSRGIRFVDPASVQGEFALKLVRLHLSLVALVGPDARLLRAWMHSHNDALGGSPEKRIQTPDGLTAVLGYLDHTVQMN